MREDNVPTNSGGFFLGGLTLLFIGLKLTGYIDWSWWLVLLPLWMPGTIAVLTLLLLLIWKVSKESTR